MVTIVKRKKALSVSPLKSSQTIGAALAFLGIKHAIPMLHGAQGCSAFAKVFFVRHFREPIPLQTTAMDQVSSVMGAEDNIVQGLRILCEKSKPTLIGIPSTGLAETQGSDMNMAVRIFRDKYPQYNHVKCIPVSTADYSGCLETGFAAATTALIDTLVAKPNCQVQHKTNKDTKAQRQIVVLLASSHTPGDLETIKEIIASFAMQAVLIPDLSDSLDGHLSDTDFSPLTIGGTEVTAFEHLAQSAACIVIGASMNKAADLLCQRTQLKDYRFDHLMDLNNMDQFIHALAEISGHAIPEKILRNRAQLQDAMLDTHFMLSKTKFALAADPDLLIALSQFLGSMGAQIVAAVCSINAPILKKLNAWSVTIGDLEELEKLANAQSAEIIISNSHAVETAKRLALPIFRAGFPQFDVVGGYQRVWVGYQGMRQTLFDLANIINSLQRGEMHAYQSIYSQKLEY